MTEPPNSGSGLTDGAPEPKKQQETVLLTDIPDTASLVAEQALPLPASTNLSSNSLAALSQRYNILAEAGHGSMGNVYKARDRETGEIVALKLLKPEIASDQAMMDRFKNELLFARKITHKNVCRVHEFNRIGGIACISMEYVEGESLRSVLNRFGGLPLRKGTAVGLQICSGLKEAHAQGIVHRDLKPENVMIDVHGNVKIMDFGIARSMEAGTRLTGSMVGTPAYMAPEQVAGKPVDYRTDIYSLGLMLYEMFTGSQVFQADTPVAVALKQMRELPPPPHTIDPNIPVGIERAILKCLEKEPAKRFQSLAELENVLRSPAVPGVPVALAPTQLSHATDAAPPGPLSVKPEHRRRSLVVWILFGAFVTLATLAAMQWKTVVDSSREVSPPPAMPAPEPPEFAFEKISAQPAETEPADTTEAPPVVTKPPSRSEAKKPSPAHAKFPAAGQPKLAASASKGLSAPTEPGPVAEASSRRELAPAKRTAREPLLESAPPDVQQRAQKAFGETGPPKDKNALRYLWVGRYAREEAAQSAAKKIEGLGLPVTVIPRRGLNGELFIVITGPFGEKRVSDVMQWLEAQGFHAVHPVKGPAAIQNPNP